MEANVRALDRADGEVMNLGTGVGTSVNDIVRELNAILGSAIEPIYEGPRAGEIQRIYLDASHAKQILGWAPGTTFRDGLTKTVEWSKAHGV